MLKKFLRPSIIVAIQLILLAILIICITPFLLRNTDSLNHFRQLVQHFKWALLMIHGLFYAVLYFAWPFLINLLSQKQASSPSEEQLRCALNARFYLIGAFVIFEVLNLLR
ncbi:hypothetical protein [Legionella waltersii]|uniref:Uncharacterized protein n=1 Tax=Legionella waltersii TaxID=66969 RepID=A0A0W1AC04_9GAMM|nr:hypothetical protein [Legionella waltersii]KTD78874.1 hypothetical protein Lwal_1644 [Legionella waltersii]SNU96437.1 Uncharacterised protein [Legionella waltersii]